LNNDLLEQIQPVAKQLGLSVTALSIKDITFPGELKKMFAEVVRAQQEGVAALERARGEAASLRSLANTSKMLENNPSLMNLRLLQAFSVNPQNTLVLEVKADKAVSTQG
jgi:regulator of protease activity HflC (stomatin/prohibitin superfamily)